MSKATHCVNLAAFYNNINAINFKTNLLVNLRKHRHAYRDLPDNEYDNDPGNYPNQNIPLFFDSLFQQFGFDRVKEIAEWMQSTFKFII